MNRVALAIWIILVLVSISVLAWWVYYSYAHHRITYTLSPPDKRDLIDFDEEIKRREKLIHDRRKD